MRLCNPENIWRLLLRIPGAGTFQRDGAWWWRRRRRQTRPAPTLICLTYNSGRVQDISQLPICFMTLLKGLQHPRRFFHELGTIPQQDVLISTPLSLLWRINKSVLLLATFTWSTKLHTYVLFHTVINVYYILT